MYVQSSLDSEPEEFLNPNKLSEDGTVAISGYSFSENGQMFAYGLSSKGSDWITIKVEKCCITTNFIKYDKEYFQFVACSDN